MDTPMNRGAAAFDTTSWSLILAAAGGDRDGSAGPLADFCRRYWSPALAFVIAQGYTREEAEDLTQSFFGSVVAGKFLQQADRERGRFRSFLLTALKNFISNDRDRSQAQKRGGGSVHVPFDAVSWENAPTAIAPATPDREFDRNWALAVLQRTLDAVAAEQAPGTRLDHLLPFLTADDDAPRYRDLAATLGTTEGALRTSVHRVRAKFRRQLRHEIAATVTREEDVDDEIRFLINALSA